MECRELSSDRRREVEVPVHTSPGIRMLRSTFLLLFLASPLPAQTSQPLTQAARSITAVDVARRIGIIADDSMMGRDTPSRGLDLTAAYVADQFRSFGLKTSLQRYPITKRRLRLNRSYVLFSAGGRTDSAGFTNAVRYDGGVVPEQPMRSAAMLVGGPQTAETAGQLDVRNKAVVYVPTSKAEPQDLQQVMRVLFLAHPKALLLLSEADSAAFASAIPKRAPERTVIGLATGKPVVLQVHPSAVRNALAAAGLDLPSLRKATTTMA